MMQRSLSDPIGNGLLFRDEDFERVSQYAQAKLGISLDESKRNILLSRISRRMKEIGADRFDSYFSDLVSRGNCDEESYFVSLLTTNITSFFRESHHFELLKQHITENRSAAKDRRKIKVWSAGCSSGQEAYSIALTLFDMVENGADFEFEITASDIDEQVLAKAKNGIFGPNETRDLSNNVKDRLFDRPREGQTDLQICRKIRDRVSFRKLNLVDLPDEPTGLDFIFCRNVVIYFDKDTQCGLWKQFYNRLNSRGVLYLGQAERLSGGFENKFEKIGRTTYQKRAICD